MVSGSPYLTSSLRFHVIDIYLLVPVILLQVDVYHLVHRTSINLDDVLNPVLFWTVLEFES
jgi:hypothetical protein